jgi:hypothetical protein
MGAQLVFGRAITTGRQSSATACPVAPGSPNLENSHYISSRRERRRKLVVLP